MARVRLEPVPTSYNRNKLGEFKETGISMRAITYTIGGGTSLAIVLPRAIGISGETPEASMARAVIGFLIFVIVGMISFKVTASPRYDMEGLDRMLIKLKELFNKKPVKLTEEKLTQRMVESEPRLYTGVDADSCKILADRT